MYKTNAPSEVIFDIVRLYKKLKCNNVEKDIFKNIDVGSPSYITLSKEIKYAPKFDLNIDNFKN